MPHTVPVVSDNESGPTSPEVDTVPRQHLSLACVPVGSHNKESAAAYCDSKQGKQIYASSAAEDRRESTEEGEDEEEEEEGREEEEEQRPLCSGVVGYPLVRDQALGLGLSSAPDGQAGEGSQEQAYKGEQRSPHLSLVTRFLTVA